MTCARCNLPTHPRLAERLLVAGAQVREARRLVAEASTAEGRQLLALVLDDAVSTMTELGGGCCCGALAEPASQTRRRRER